MKLARCSSKFGLIFIMNQRNEIRGEAMKKHLLLKWMPLTSLGSILLSGCVYHEATVYQPPGRVAYSPPVHADAFVAQNEVVMPAPPPATAVEDRTGAAPGPGYVWISGSWVWHDQWTWEHGHWARPPYRGAVWVPPHYAYRNGYLVYISGGWRS
jgi:hypothetical protein